MITMLKMVEVLLNFFCIFGIIALAKWLDRLPVGVSTVIVLVMALVWTFYYPRTGKDSTVHGIE